MALTTRITLTRRDTAPPDAPEDLFGASLSVLFPGQDVTSQHGDADHGLLYTSPHLPHPLPLAVAEVEEEKERVLFSHYLWNSSLLVAELVEAGTLGLGVQVGDDGCGNGVGKGLAPGRGFDVSGLSVIELGAGTGLSTIMAGLVGAKRVVATDYPAPAVLKTLRENVVGAIKEKFASPGRFAVEEVLVAGHAWGELDTPLARENRRAFDRVVAADCLWMPWQHGNLRRSIAWFLGEGEGARAWVVGAFHTGRDNLGAFFEEQALAEDGLEVENLWERDCDGHDREWAWDRGAEDVIERKRWMAVGVLRRIRKLGGDGKEGRR